MLNSLRVILLLMVSLAVLPGLTQTSPSVETRMDEIKLDESLVYAEAFDSEKNIAFQNALTELTVSCNELRVDREKDVLTYSDLLPVVEELSYKRGDRYTVMVFIPMSKMLDMTGRAGGPTNISQQNQVKESSAEPPAQPATPIVQQTTSASFHPFADDLLRALCGQDNWIEIKGFIKTYKEAGKISATGNVTTYADVPEDAYAILMDQMGGILSILSPKISNPVVNCRTNRPDSYTNHSNCKFIVWYK